jgi:hypothetical protein
MLSGVISLSSSQPALHLRGHKVLIRFFSEAGRLALRPEASRNHRGCFGSGYRAWAGFRRTQIVNKAALRNSRFQARSVPPDRRRRVSVIRSKAQRRGLPSGKMTR